MTKWLDESLRARAGALAPAAEPFLKDGGLARGPDGVIALCERMEQWLTREDVDEEAERRFVEQAGAALGLLLIDHVGDAGHVARDGAHRVRLGRYGYFDPFSAVDRALDATDVRRSLARQLAVAEAEGAGQGPISRVVHALLAALARMRPDLTFADQFEHSLWLRPLEGGAPFEVDLKRAIESTRDQSADAVEAVVQKLLAMLPGAPTQQEDFSEVRARIVPRIARADALLPGLYNQPLSDELVVALMVEHPGRARYVREAELGDWQLDHAAVLQVALENLRERSENARIAATETAHGALWVARTGDGRDSARVLLGSLHSELRARIGPHVLLGIPHRDTFFACDASNAALVEALRRKTEHDAARAPHKLSARAFALR